MNRRIDKDTFKEEVATIIAMNFVGGVVIGTKHNTNFDGSSFVKKDLTVSYLCNQEEVVKVCESGDASAYLLLLKLANLNAKDFKSNNLINSAVKNPYTMEQVLVSLQNIMLKDADYYNYVESMMNTQSLHKPYIYSDYDKKLWKTVKKKIETIKQWHNSQNESAR